MENVNKNFQDKEIWRDVVGFEGLYSVSNKGRVMSLMRGKVLKCLIDGMGYPFVILYKANSKPKQIKIHKLVAESFIDNPEKLPYINHIDENKKNNNVGNLEWCSPSYNTNYSIYKCSCKIKQLDKNGNLIKIWNSFKEIKNELGYDASTIRKVCKGKQRYAYNFKWEYADPSSQLTYNRPVAALTKDGELVGEYKSAAEASRCLKIKSSSVYYCLNGTFKSTHGLKFIYLD